MLLPIILKEVHPPRTLFYVVVLYVLHVYC